MGFAVALSCAASGACGGSHGGAGDAGGLDAAGGGDGHPSSDSGTFDAGPPLPPGPWIAFVSLRGADPDIYLIKTDGTGLQPLVTGTGMDLFPAWSPDGQEIAFTSNRGGGMTQLYVVHAGSGVIRPISTGLTVAASPAWSPDGKSLACVGALAGVNGMFVVDAAGGTPVMITSGKHREGAPVWAPDGKTIYFFSDRSGVFEVWSMAPDGTGIKQVTTGSGILGGPAISHDGKTLAFTQSVNNSSQVVTYDLATSAITIVSAMGDSQPSFSPAGDRLVVVTNRFDSNPEIVLVDNPGGGNPLRLTNDPSVDAEPAFQPTP